MNFHTGQDEIPPLHALFGRRIGIERGRDFCVRHEGAKEWIDLGRQISASYS